MALNTAQMWGAIEPVVRKYYGLEKQRGESEFDKIFDVSKGKEVVRHSMEFGGPGVLQFKPEGGAMGSLTMRQGPNKSFTYSVFGGEITVTWELARDVNYRAIKTVSSSLGRAQKMTPEYLAAQYLDRAFDTNYPATGDGKPLCSTSHLIVGTNASTGSNAMASPAAFSETSMEDVMTTLLSMPGPDGMPIMVQPKQAIIPPALVNTAKKLFGTDQKVGGNYNDISVVNSKRSGIDYQLFRFLGSSTRWFVQTDYTNGLFWEWDVESEFMEDNTISTLKKTYVSFFRARWGCDDWRSIYGINA